MDTEDFIKKAKKVHGDNKYDYSKVNYVHSKIEVEIICPIHGSFKQTPNSHLSGHGCRECKKLSISASRSLTTEKFIKKAKEIHEDKYDYSKVKYVDYDTEVEIICPIHGSFKQTPAHHLSGHGCRECGKLSSANSNSLTTEEFIKKAKKIHGDKYDYSKVNYVHSKIEVEIICPTHGSFKQTPTVHLSGKGCPDCMMSKLEREIELYLKQKKTSYVHNKTWDWLVYKGNQSIDFYLPDYNAGIEAQGIQHFEDVEFFGRGGYDFEKRVDMDENKRKLCEEHGIKMYYYSKLSKENDPYPYPYEVYEDLDELINKIIQDDNPD